GLYPAPVFGPTRLNIADDPSRGASLREPCKHSVLAALKPADLYTASTFRGAAPDVPSLTGCCKLLFVWTEAGSSVAQETTSHKAWLAERGRSLESFLSENPPEVQALNTSLVAYGRELYDAGRPYWIYSETVNSVAARAPTVRRQLQQAWDLGFSWLAMEPYSHHVPLPGILLCAILTACLVWGWVREAGLFALAWGGLLRIGDATNAKRADLVLPRDVLFTQCFVLLRIQEPKTRLRMARHQAARVEPQDLVELIDLVFQGLRSDERLWPRSQQTLRKRLDAVLARLGITPHEGEKALDLGSFRPGGATYLLQQTE
ncbi:unnamed protein product, partial [Symbiodinium sp. KB8]